MQPERYEPLPGLPQIPAWLWRRMGSAARAAAVATVLIAVAAAGVLIPVIRQAQQERAEADRRAATGAEEQRIQALQAEQRPHFGRSAAGGRVEAAGDLRAAIRADALRRVQAGTLDGPIRAVECERFPRTVGELAPERDPAVRRGRYACMAVTALFAPTDGSTGGSIGHPYRALLDFETGRYAFCKVTGRPDPTPDQRVATPRACGG